ncbi:hypothetical protein [Methylomagnum sp.]
MKTIAKTMTALLCFAVFNAPAFAEEKNASPPKPPHQGMAGMGDMSGMGGMSEEQTDAHLRQVQEYLLINYDYVHQIRDAKDEKEQARLKDEWLKAMKHHLKLNQVPKQLMMHGVPEHNAPEK